MKSKKYLLSSYYLNQISDNEEYVVADPILYEEIKRYLPSAKVKLEPTYKVSREEFSKENNLQKKLYEKYIHLISERLNEIHNTNYSLKFWEKIIGLEVLMHIHHCRSMYALIKQNEDRNYELHTLSLKHFRIPEDNDEYRKLTQHGQIGYEQLLTTFFLNHDENVKNFDFTENSNNFKKEKSTCLLNKIRKKSVKQLVMIFCRRMLTRIFKLIVSPSTLLVETIFSDQHYIKLMLISFGKVQMLNNFNAKNLDTSIEPSKRVIISKKINDGDEFDNYFFQSLYYFSPKTWLENFTRLNKFYENNVNSFINLKTIISESASESAQFFSARASMINVQTYYNEHNLLQHYLMGNIIWFLKRRYDKYLSLGWTDKSYDVLPVGSLYKWKSKRKNKKNIKILFISSVASNKSPFHSSMYGEQGMYNSKAYFQMTVNFLSNLKKEYLKEVYFRGHPHVKDIRYSDYAISDNYFLKSHLDKVNTVDYSTKNSAVDLISKCEIVVINYLSTPWVQSLLANVPTVIIWNEETYFLDDDYLDYFDELIANHIVFKKGEDAAQFLNEICMNPNKWWLSNDVQRARSNFLKSNFMENEKLSSYILDLSKK